MLSWATAYYASEWIIRLAMLCYVPQRRSAAASRSWLLLIFLLPWPGVILYYLIGRPYLPRGRIEAQRHISAMIRSHWPADGAVDSSFLSPPWSEMATLARNLGDFAMRPGNHVELLPDYQGSVDRIVQDIDAAQDHAHLLYYIFGDDRTGRQIADALVRAAGRGVRCRLLLDAAASRKSLRTMGPALRQAGIEVIPLLPSGLLRLKAGRFDLRNHRKIAVIDGSIGYVGSQNLINADFKKPLTYEELVARVTGPVVRQLQTVLLTDYYVETGKGPEDINLLKEVPPAGESHALALPSGPSYPHLNNLDLVIALTHAAQKRIVITSPYFVPSDALTRAMATAVLRGVEVHLVVCNQIDQFLVGLAQRSYYAELLEAGVHIHPYRPRFLHAKHLTFDDSIALIGSSNMDIRSFQLNEEISLLIHDPTVIADLRRIQEGYFAGAQEITREAWHARPRTIRVLQNIARLADSLL